MTDPIRAALDKVWHLRCDHCGVKLPADCPADEGYGCPSFEGYKDRKKREEERAQICVMLVAAKDQAND
jgi:hypothetical protein